MREVLMRGRQSNAAASKLIFAFSQPRRFPRWTVSLKEALTAWHKERRDRNDLAAMSNRERLDIGLSLVGRSEQPK